MAYLINGIIHTPLQVQVETNTQFSQSTDTFDLCNKDSKSTQTFLRKPIDINGKLQMILAHVNQYPSLQVRLLQWGAHNETALEITRTKADLPPQRGGPLTLASLSITSDLDFKFRVAGEIIRNGCLSKGSEIDNNELKKLFNLLSDTHVFCTGILKDEFKSVCTGIRYEPKCLMLKSYPFERYVAASMGECKCLMWYKLRQNASQDERAAAAEGNHRCTHCNKAYRDVRQRNISQLPKMTRDIRNQRTQASSKYPLSLMSPNGVKRKLRNVNLDRKKSKKQITSLSEQIRKYTEVELDEAQSTELSSFIEGVTAAELDTVLATEKASTAAALKEAFWQDQKNNKQGKRSNKWSMATYRVALSIHSLSPAAYDAIQSWGIFHLPSKSSLRQFSTTCLHGDGPYFDYIQDQSMKYKSYQQECTAKGMKRPQSDGVVILDEVKVIGKVAWNSKNGKMVGLAMDPKDTPTLSDLDPDLLEEQERKPAEYFLQFLWRDLTSDFDIIGPHYSTVKSMDCAFTVACMLDAVDAFQAFGFKVSAVVMDGASTNLAMVKELSGHGRGTYGVKNDQADPHAITPWFQNPLFTAETIYMIICPTHQLKNMVNQLWASREGGAKRFESGEGIGFGWQQIIGVWDREKARRDADHVRMVKGLLESHIERDAWTKLNVKPAKIMQQPALLAELFSYANPDDGARPQDAAPVMATYNYLSALSKLFENGFLLSSRDGSSKITNMDAPVLRNIQEGYEFFKNWWQELDDEYDDFQPTSPFEKRFISWQTYDLLRICVYGFAEFARAFLQRHPGHYLLAMKLNGSAVETLFSQFKYVAGGKLTSLNYTTAKRSVMLRRDIHGHHKNNRGYRDVPLYTADVPLRRQQSRRNLGFDRDT